MKNYIRSQALNLCNRLNTDVGIENFVIFIKYYLFRLIRKQKTRYAMRNLKGTPQCRPNHEYFNYKRMDYA